MAHYFLLTTLALLFCTHLPSEEVKKALIVGMELSYPPFETIDKEGNPCGISVGMAKALGVFLNRAVIITNIPYIGLIPSLKTGKVDLVISSLTRTAERERTISFSQPYFTVGLSLLVSNKSAINSIEDVNREGVVVVVKQGTTGESYARKNLVKAKVLSLDTEAACILEVSQRKADVFIYDPFSIFNQWKKNKATTHMVLKPFYKEFWAIGMRKGDDSLKHQVDTFLVGFHQQHGFEKLIDLYLPEQKKEFANRGIPFFYEL